MPYQLAYATYMQSPPIYRSAPRAVNLCVISAARARESLDGMASVLFVVWTSAVSMPSFLCCAC